MRTPKEKSRRSELITGIYAAGTSHPSVKNPQARFFMSQSADTATAPRSAPSSPPAGSGQSLEDLCINAIRVLAMDAVQKADSGHPGTPMALAPLAYVLWTQHLRYNPADPNWLNRDRFVLSAGHASMLLYSVFYLTGYGLTLDDSKQFLPWQ